MATLSVRLRNEANTSTIATLTNAYEIEFQVERNDLGSGSFRMDKRDPQRPLVSRGAVVQFLLNSTPVFIGRISEDGVTEVSENDEGVEFTEFTVVDILDDWDGGVVRLSTVPQCDLVPTLDERIWSWASGESNPVSLWETWPKASAIANQGWGSPLYTGEPAGWTDPDAYFLWASSGSATDAPDGTCLFKDIFLVGAGKKVLDWGADDLADLYVNGKKVQSMTTETIESRAIRKKQTYEFETTAGFLTLSWRVENLPFAAGGGPPGANPAAIIASLRENSPEGDVIWRTSASGIGANTATTMRVLEYPGSEPGHAVGAVIRLAAEQNPIIWNTWTMGFSDLLDANGEAFAVISELSLRLYDDSMLDVLRTMSQTWIDFRVDPGDGKELVVANKGTMGSAATTTLVTAYSTAGVADPDSVNVLDLEWEISPAKFTALAVRHATGWIELGAVPPGGDDRWGTLRIEQINDIGTATAIGNQLLALYEQEQFSASFSYLPLNEPSDVPLLGGINVHDTWAIPGPIDHDTTTEQVVQSITVTQSSDGLAEFAIEVGPPLLDDIEWLERAIRRAAPGTIGGRAATASASSGKAPYDSVEKIRASTPTSASPAHCIASAPNAVAGTSVAPNLFVGLVVTLRLIGDGATGTSSVTVSDGTNSWTLSGSGEGVIDYEPVNKTWTTTTQLTVTINSVGHTNLHVFADVGEVG